MGNTYDISCNIAHNDWSCDEMNGHCNDIQIAPNPEIPPNVAIYTTLNNDHSNTEAVQQINDITPISPPSDHNETTVAKYHTERLNGDLFVLVALCLAILVCIIVGVAEIQKSAKISEFQRSNPELSGLATPTAEFTYSRSQISQSDKSRRHYMFDP